jgi:hypothetical protein
VQFHVVDEQVVAVGQGGDVDFDDVGAGVQAGFNGLERVRGMGPAILRAHVMDDEGLGHGDDDTRKRVIAFAATVGPWF